MRSRIVAARRVAIDPFGDHRRGAGKRFGTRRFCGTPDESFPTDPNYNWMTAYSWRVLDHSPMVIGYYQSMLHTV
jgi:hypothetical protein